MSLSIKKISLMVATAAVAALCALPATAFASSPVQVLGGDNSDSMSYVADAPGTPGQLASGTLTVQYYDASGNPQPGLMSPSLAAKVRFTLDNVSVDTDDFKFIYVLLPPAVTAEIELVGNNTVTLDGTSQGIFTTTNTTFMGSGSLKITGKSDTTPIGIYNQYSNNPVMTFALSQGGKIELDGTAITAPNKYIVTIYGNDCSVDFATGNSVTNPQAYYWTTDDTNTAYFGETSAVNATPIKVMTIENPVSTPTAAQFDFTAPTNLTADGTAKAATVTAKSDATGIGAVSAIYYSVDNGTTWSTTAPTEADTYLVKIDVAAGTGWAAATDVTDSSWTFTVTAAPTPDSDPTPADDVVPDTSDATPVVPVFALAVVAIVGAVIARKRLA